MNRFMSRNVENLYINLVRALIKPITLGRIYTATPRKHKTTGAMATSYDPQLCNVTNEAVVNNLLLD